MCAAFQDGVVEQEAFLPHGQEHDRSIKFSEYPSWSVLLSPRFYALPVCSFVLGINWYTVLLGVPGVLPITGSALYQKIYCYISSLTDSKCEWGGALEAEVSDLWHVRERQGQVLVNIFFWCYSRAVVPACCFLVCVMRILFGLFLYGSNELCFHSRRKHEEV